MSNEIKTETTSTEREQDGRYALKMESKSSVKRWMKRDAEVAKRRAELEAQYGEDAWMYA